MKETSAKCALLLGLILLLATILGIDAYSQVVVSGSSGSDQGPRIYKALNTDLIFPKIFNSTENVVSTTTTTTTTLPPPIPYNHQQEQEQEPSVFVTPSHQQQQEQEQEPVEASSEEPPAGLVEATATGRAVDYRTKYPFGQLITPLMKSGRPQQFKARTRPAQHRNRPKGNRYQTAKQGYRRGQTVDRFTPGQGVAATLFKNHQEHSKDTYSFPPLNNNYPSPSDDTKTGQASDAVTSYLPPASGNGYVYPGPAIDPSGYLYPKPGGGDKATAGGTMSTMSAGPPDDDPNNDDSIGVLPASAQDNLPPTKNQAGKDAGGAGADAGPLDDGGPDAGDDAKPAGDAGPLPPLDISGGEKPSDDNKYDPKMEYATPPPGWLAANPDSAAPKPADHEPDHEPDHDIVHDHDHDIVPDIVHDHDHDYPEHPHPVPHFEHHDHYPDHFSDSFPSYPSYPSYHHFPEVSYPEVIYDDHHHHHVEPPPPPPPPPPTTPPPPPPPPPEPRVKKYSYFYIGRKLWYIPLYFTVWFAFYVLWLVIKSIGRHKVNLPNHYVTRRDVPDYSSQSRDEYINEMTVKVLEQIDNFKLKYLN